MFPILTDDLSSFLLSAIMTELFAMPTKLRVVIGQINISLKLTPLLSVKLLMVLPYKHTVSDTMVTQSDPLDQLNSSFVYTRRGAVHHRPSFSILHGEHFYSP